MEVLRSGGWPPTRRSSWRRQRFKRRRFRQLRYQSRCQECRSGSRHRSVGPAIKEQLRLRHPNSSQRGRGERKRSIFISDPSRISQEHAAPRPPVGPPAFAAAVQLTPRQHRAHGLRPGPLQGESSGGGSGFWGTRVPVEDLCSLFSQRLDGDDHFLSGALGPRVKLTGPLGHTWPMKLNRSSDLLGHHDAPPAPRGLPMLLSGGRSSRCESLFSISRMTLTCVCVCCRFSFTY